MTEEKTSKYLIFIKWKKDIAIFEKINFIQMIYYRIKRVPVYRREMFAEIEDY